MRLPAPPTPAPQSLSALLRRTGVESGDINLSAWSWVKTCTGLAMETRANSGQNVGHLREDSGIGGIG